MLKTRLLTVVLTLPLFATALLWMPQHLWAWVLLPVVWVSSWEWSGLAGYRRLSRAIYATVNVITALGLLYLPYLSNALSARTDTAVYALSCAFWLLAAPFWLTSRWATRNALLLGVVGWIALVPMWLALVRLQPTPWSLLLFMSVVWIADTAAYFAGKRWGRTKLAPQISPGKTWEGALGAAVAVGVYYAVLSLATPAGDRYLTGWWGLMVFAVILGLSIEGDLFESLLKRRAGVKDSGQVLPGHGGLLDRIDGLTATMPAAALAVYFR